MVDFYFFSTITVHLVTKAAIAPRAAKAGASNTPTAPAVRGNSAIVSSFSFFIIIFRAFPSRTISLTFSIIFFSGYRKRLSFVIVFHYSNLSNIIKS